jgi:hypothetical protein
MGHRCEKKTASKPFSMGWDALSICVQLAVSVLDELVKAVPGVVALMYLQVVVEGSVNGFDTRLDGVADDI